MTMAGGFIDLRQHSETGITHVSFWPSFTDIMMVVVVIFMMASSVLILRNMALVRDLRATIDAQHSAEEAARSASQTSATLEEQLAQTQNELSQLRMRLMRANEINQSRSQEISRQAQRLLDLEAEKQQLTASLQQARRESQLHQDQLAQAQAEYAQLNETHATLRTRLQDVLDQLSQTEKSNQAQAGELAEFRRQRALSDQQLVSLQGEYDELRNKYDKLIRPARSAVGKHVVSVRYFKEDDKIQILLKESEDDPDYKSVSADQLNSRLARLKDTYAGNLYVKVIIPENSGLSYSEAWNFTYDLLKKYDYYHQGEP
jgi:chromosome segregation ATPase